MSIEDLNRELKEKNLIGYWTIPNRSDGFREPEPSFEPMLWKWHETHAALEKAAATVPREEAHRRFIGFQHPKFKMGTTHTLLMGAQLIQAGERAPAHRHTMEAIRFVVKGKGACTVVDGEPFPMEEGDLITTPSSTWHDHISAEDGPVIWLDGANGPMIQYYQIGFADLYAEPYQRVARPVGHSEREYGSARPPQPRLESPTFRPPYRYRWEETEKSLRALGEGPGDPFDGVLLRYADPVTGGYTLPTMSCEIQMLRPGEKTRSHRHTHTVIYHAVRGKGTTVIAGKRFDWEQGDSFIVPVWSWHSHENQPREPAMLFSINDRPALEALGFCREQAGSNRAESQRP